MFSVWVRADSTSSLWTLSWAWMMYCFREGVRSLFGVGHRPVL